MDKDLSRFLSELRDSRQASPHTVKAYASDLRGLDAWSKRARLRNLTKPRLAAWVRSMGELAPATLMRKQAAARTFYESLVERGVIKTNPAAALPPVREWRKVPTTLLLEEVRVLIAAHAGKSNTNVRNRALLELIYGAGALVSEVSALNVADLDTRRAEVQLGKGTPRKRTVLLRRLVMAAMAKWMTARDDIMHEADAPDRRALFVSVRTGKRFTTRGVQRAVDAAAQRCGMEGISPQVLRQSAAKHMLERGIPVEKVQAFLGHESVATTDGLRRHVERDLG